MTAGLVKHWLESGRLELPLPASGRTAERWERLARLAEGNIVAARVAETHVDAVAILHELRRQTPRHRPTLGCVGGRITGCGAVGHGPQRRVHPQRRGSTTNVGACLQSR